MNESGRRFFDLEDFNVRYFLSKLVEDEKESIEYYKCRNEVNTYITNATVKLSKNISWMDSYSPKESEYTLAEFLKEIQLVLFRFLIHCNNPEEQHLFGDEEVELFINDVNHAIDLTFEHALIPNRFKHLFLGDKIKHIADRAHLHTKLLKQLKQMFKVDLQFIFSLFAAFIHTNVTALLFVLYHNEHKAIKSEEDLILLLNKNAPFKFLVYQSTIHYLPILFIPNRKETSTKIIMKEHGCFGTGKLMCPGRFIAVKTLKKLIDIFNKHNITITEYTIGDYFYMKNMKDMKITFNK